MNQNMFIFNPVKASNLKVMKANIKKSGHQLLLFLKAFVDRLFVQVKTDLQGASFKGFLG